MPASLFWRLGGLSLGVPIHGRWVKPSRPQPAVTRVSGVTPGNSCCHAAHHPGPQKRTGQLSRLTCPKTVRLLPTANLRTLA